MKFKVIYKNYLQPLIVFSPIFVLIALMQLKTANYSKFPEWYKMSTVIHNIFENGIGKSKIFAGNSYIQSGIRTEIVMPEKLDSTYVFARGNTPSVELLLWLYKHQIYPDVIIAELNTRQLLPQYFADFDIYLPDSTGSFDLFKNKTEISLRYFMEKNFTFLTYRITPKDIIYNFRHSDSLKEFAMFLFLPDSSVHKEADFSPWGYTSIPEELEKRYNVLKKTKKYAADYIRRVQGSAPNVNATLNLWKFLIDKFKSHGTIIFLLRLPKDKVIIDAENSITAGYFQGLKAISSETGSYYIDLTSPEYIEDFHSSFIDGAHWNNKGAVKLSELLSIIIKEKIKEIKHGRNGEEK